MALAGGEVHPDDYRELRPWVQQTPSKAILKGFLHFLAKYLLKQSSHIMNLFYPFQFFTYKNPHMLSGLYKPECKVLSGFHAPVVMLYFRCSLLCGLLLLR